MRKILSLPNVLIAFSALFLICGPVLAETKDKPIIGISKIVKHPALDAVEQGIQDELKAEKIDATFDLQNANGDPNTAATIAGKFKDEKVAVAVGIATPTAQSLVKAFSSIKSPVIYSAVTDPVSAGLVASTDKGGEYVTGISDMTPVKAQLEFLVKLVPSVKKIGMVYTGGEANAVVLKNAAEKAAKELGLQLIAVSIATSAEVKTAADSISGRVDAFYISTDNTVVSAISSLTAVAKAKKKPVISADPTSSEKVPVLASWGFNYYKMGLATGRLIGEILNGKKTSDIPTVYMTSAKDVDILVNLDVAKALGIKVSKEIVDLSSIVIQNGVATKK